MTSKIMILNRKIIGLIFIFEDSEVRMPRVLKIHNHSKGGKRRKIGAM